MSDTTPSPVPASPAAAGAIPSGGTITLKVLTGSQVGVEVALPDGQFTFGSDEGADIRFLDVTMAPLHGQLRIGGGKIQLQATGGAIVTGSGLAIDPGGDSWHEVAQLDRVRAGTTQFALGDRAARWADVLDPSDPVGDGAARRGSTGRDGQGLGLVGPALAVLGVLAVAALVWQGSGAARPDAQLAETPSTEAALREAIDGFPFAPVLTLEIEADGRSIVTGYVETAAERRAVEAAVAEIDPEARRRIWVREAMRADIEGMIESQGLEVASSIARDGVVSLEGRVLDPEQAATLVAMIENEVFGVAGVDDRLQTANSVLADVEALLAQAGLNDVVIARLDGLLIETTGVIPNARAERWIGFVQTYANRFADILPLRSFVTLESAPAGAVAEPLVVGGAGQLDGLPGRRIPVDRLGPDQDLRLDEVFGAPSGAEAETGSDAAAPQDGTGGAAGQNAPAVAGSAGRAGTTAVAPAQQSAASSSPIATAMVLDFAARNPVVVDTIIREVTGGRFSGLDELRAAPGPDADPDPGPNPVSGASSQPLPVGAQAAGLPPLATRASDGRAALAAQGPGVVSASPALATPGLVEGAVRLADASGPAPARATGAVAPASEAGVASVTPSPDLGLSPVPGGGAFPLFPTVRTANLGILGATASLLRPDDGTAPGLPGGFMDGSDLDRVPPDLLRLVREQQSALEQGSSLLPPSPPPPSPLAALPTDPAALRPAGCWLGAHVESADVPAALLWLDLLSLGDTGDLGRLDAATQLQVFDVALSPVRLLRCMGGEDMEYAQQLIQASAFLNEIWRNDSFLDYVFRDVPRIELAVSGVDLTGQRRIALEDQRILREGSAPDAASRITVIGELGALLRVRDGYRLALYPGDLDWRIEE